MSKMQKEETSKEIIPVDIRKIRQALDLTLKQMGEKIRLYSRNPNAIPGTRVNEWESGSRPVPAYVYSACASILMDEWSDDRHQAAAPRQREVDIFYSDILNLPLGDLFRLEHVLSQSRSLNIRQVTEEVKKARIAQMRYLEVLLNIRMAYVFATEEDLGCCDLDAVA